MAETVVSAKSKVQSSKFKVRKRTGKPVKLEEIAKQTAARVSSGFEEVDRVLGGGLVPGQVVLLAGEPGIGKSTLLLQMALAAEWENPLRQDDEGQVNSQSQRLYSKDGVLYVSGEESLRQIKLRTERLFKNSKEAKTQRGNNLELMAETDTDLVVDQLTKSRYGLIMIDSIQTMSTGDLRSAAGTVSQVRESAARLAAAAKETETPLILVGHITKEGMIAGPKILEHLVDTVLTLEGERYQNLRLLRTTKNRFGPVEELGVFEMTGAGMVEVKNPSAVFLDEELLEKPGSAVACLLEGSRPILIEIEALVVPTSLPVPRRIGQGLSSSRVALMAAVLQKQAGLRLADKDIFVKIAGGLHVSEPAVDLAVALAMASSFQNKTLPKKTVAIGEVGLLGEIRKVTRLDLREKEAKRLGFEQIISAKDRDLRRVILDNLR